MLPTAGAQAAAPIMLTGLDAHDGMITQVGSTYYLYGTRYGCGFTWTVHGPFCGFGVWQSTDKQNWQFVRLLFDPNANDAYRNISWINDCGNGGCFNPRMMQRQSDGVWILYFNSPADFSWNGSNAYYVMGCAGPAGPCGDTPDAGPHASMHKPNMTICYHNGDFSIFYAVDGHAYIYCTMWNQTIRVEQLDAWWANGNGVGGTISTQPNVESPGMYRDAATGYYVLTYSLPNCGYCGSDGMGYAVASSPLGPFVAAPTPIAMRAGQPRTVSFIDGQPVEWWDLWNNGARNETTAAVQLVTINPGLPPQ